MLSGVLPGPVSSFTLREACVQKRELTGRMNSTSGLRPESEAAVPQEPCGKKLNSSDPSIMQSAPLPLSLSQPKLENGHDFCKEEKLPDFFFFFKVKAHSYFPTSFASGVDWAAAIHDRGSYNSVAVELRDVFAPPWLPLARKLGGRAQSLSPSGKLR